MCDIKIKDLLTDESKWTQGASARSSDGMTENYNSDKAVCFCLAGAARRCYPDITEYRVARFKMLEDTGFTTLVFWNDAPERTFQEVKDLVERLDV